MRVLESPQRRKRDGISEKPWMPSRFFPGIVAENGGSGARERTFDAAPGDGASHGQSAVTGHEDGESGNAGEVEKEKL